jgi:uncharacterized protein with NAD-binding domain and iron-sulfur cluster
MGASARRILSERCCSFHRRREHQGKDTVRRALVWCRTMARKPIKVAIVGGGCAGVAAAFELSRPEHEGKYAVTIYQLGWRLGGKGASGRGPAERIEEHGLHLWMGFYENAFRLVRECYAEAKRDPRTCRLASWRDGFVPDNACGVMDRLGDGRWLPWLTTFPPLPGFPGDPEAPRPWTVSEYLARSVALLRTLFEVVQVRTGVVAVPGGESAAAAVGPGGEDVPGAINRLMRYGEMATLSALLESLRILDNVVRTLPNYPGEMILQFHDAITRAARRQLESLVEKDEVSRRLWEVAELVLATIRGIVRFRLVTDPRGFDAVNDYDCREWLKLNGAPDRALDSGFLRGLYDLAFAYEDGDPARPRIAAGQALRGGVRAFFTYRGAFFWKMQAGMGDVVFAPFYEVLQRRGVRFAFFHRLERVRLAPQPSAEGKRYVEALELDVQAEIRNQGEYAPLVDVRGLPCWPSEPQWNQLVDGARLKREKWRFESHWDRRCARRENLRVGRDFDLVVLAVGLGALPHTCQDLIASSQRWRAMVEHCKTVPTQALQLWLTEDAAGLGWNGAQMNVSGFTKPFDTWADMRQLIREERFPVPVASIAYFCNVLGDAGPADDPAQPDYPDRRREEVRRNAIRFLEHDVRHLWPRACRSSGGFRWELLADPAPRGRRRARVADESAVDTQFWTANVNPTDRYSLSLPGTLKYRISPLDDTFDNLTIAGDWTDCGFNEGCVEAAVMSGRLAAHAISRSPRLEDIVGFDHP